MDEQAVAAVLVAFLTGGVVPALLDYLRSRRKPPEPPIMRDDIAPEATEQPFFALAVRLQGDLDSQTAKTAEAVNALAVWRRWAEDLRRRWPEIRQWKTPPMLPCPDDPPRPTRPDDSPRH